MLPLLVETLCRWLANTHQGLERTNISIIQQKAPYHLLCEAQISSVQHGKLSHHIMMHLWYFWVYFRRDVFIDLGEPFRWDSEQFQGRLSEWTWENILRLTLYYSIKRITWTFVMWLRNVVCFLRKLINTYHWPVSCRLDLSLTDMWLTRRSG